MDANKVVGNLTNKNFYNINYNTREINQDGEFEKRLLNAYENQDEEALKEVCREFEGLLLNMVYKQMRATVFRSDLIPKSVGREIFESMLDDELVKEASKNRSYGLAEDLYKQLSRTLRNRKV
ncbi:MAG TPA: flagellar biosynthesis protein FlgJ [Ruminiclostridium sp.]|jgi:flagellar protein FlgJ|uniref:Flagellar biosynthesis protein FlgJ n=1 Tax=Acetivibrio saccincola TaxID=1677857 RepID=A0A2K9EHV1_9FIRM|nr:rod-binding protein [Acetivibrio saccincola]HAA42820.1 flagellar biosynthesis protein FlgJ [Ruminiclostridium sp.]AUG56081.1 flagellar rod assembly protein/muramidase FlgJ [Acetivibrio saccincola]NLW28142.1 flagellar biosynthesis protein FlgJ [Acetivibrio saccincola]PQQ65732.1 flagellar biosynthesis protein FlgJ [Acetivibrio saccincola]HOA96561.1 rod-binding protein [Acetivibrio saccincola]